MNLASINAVLIILTVSLTTSSSARELEGKIAETRETGEAQIVFGEGFGGVSDLEVGPDGYLYVVSLGQGKIFRVVPSS